MERAAEERYQEALHLMAGGLSGAGIYLCGYTAEILLKNALFLTCGAHHRDLASVYLIPALKMGRRILPWIPAENGHSLVFWAMMLRYRRSEAFRPFPVDLDNELDLRVSRLYESWWVSKRYLTDQATESESRGVLSDVDWIRERYRDLWS
jgi:hypothetical protein